MYRLATYYESKKNYVKMEYYFQIGIKHGDISCMIRLGQYYENNKNYQQMEIYYLMGINRGFDMYLTGLSEYYSRTGRIDEMIQYNLMMIDKYNNGEARFNLKKHYQLNVSKLLHLYRDINIRKDEYSQLIIKNIPLEIRHFRFKDQSIGMRIIYYHFKINQGESETTIYQQIKENDPIILDYLNIIDVTEVTKKIEEYYIIYCC